MYKLKCHSYDLECNIGKCKESYILILIYEWYDNIQAYGII